MLTQGQLAAELGLSDRHLRRWKAHGLPGVGEGKAAVYDLAAVCAWLVRSGKTAPKLEACLARLRGETPAAPPAPDVPAGPSAPADRLEPQAHGGALRRTGVDPEELEDLVPVDPVLLLDGRGPLRVDRVVAPEADRRAVGVQAPRALRAGDHQAALRVPSARTKLGLCASCRGPLGERAMACDRCVWEALRAVEARQRRAGGPPP